MHFNKKVQPFFPANISWPPVLGVKQYENRDKQGYLICHNNVHRNKYIQIKYSAKIC